MKLLSNTKGSLTVEAALVFPVVLLVIFSMIFMCVLLYQSAYLQTTADQIAQISALNWNNTKRIEALNNKNIPISTTTYLEGDLYWHLYDRDKTTKIKSIRDYAIAKLKYGNMINGMLSTQDKVDIKVKNYVVYREINITLKDSYKLPFSGFFKSFGLKEAYTIEKKSKAVINENTEFIRNVDFMADTADQLGVLDDIKASMEKVKDNVYKFLE